MASFSLNVDDISGEIKNTFADEENDEKTSAITSWIKKRRTQLKPWTEFINTKTFSKPKDIAHAGKRIIRNLDTYQTNYIVICLFLSLYCIITSPLLLIALTISCGACYYISKRGGGQKIKIAGREFSVAEQYAAVLTISIPLFFFASAGSAVFWIIGATVFTVTLHASLVEPGTAEPELEMDEVKAVTP